MVDVPSEQITQTEAVDLYRNTLNFNVISRYDPAIKQLLFTSSHCVVYKFGDEEDWIKTDYQGTVVLYLRDYKLPDPNRKDPLNYQDLQNLFCYGLILLNRTKPENFSMGLLSNKMNKHFFPRGLPNMPTFEMVVELNDNIIIVKNVLGEVYGLWVYDEQDRMKLFKTLEYCLNNDAVGQ